MRRIKNRHSNHDYPLATGWKITLSRYLIMTPSEELIGIEEKPVHHGMYMGVVFLKLAYYPILLLILKGHF